MFSLFEMLYSVAEAGRGGENHVSFVPMSSEFRISWVDAIGWSRIRGVFQANGKENHEHIQQNPRYRIRNRRTTQSALSQVSPRSHPQYG